MNRQAKVKELRTQLANLEREEVREEKIKSYGKIILKLSSQVFSKEEKNYLLTRVEDHIASGLVEDDKLDFVGRLKKKLSE